MFWRQISARSWSNTTPPCYLNGDNDAIWIITGNNHIASHPINKTCSGVCSLGVSLIFAGWSSESCIHSMATAEPISGVITWSAMLCRIDFSLTSISGWPLFMWCLLVDELMSNSPIGSAAFRLFSQWKRSFCLKAVLPLDEKLMTMSVSCSNTGPNNPERCIK